MAARRRTLAPQGEEVVGDLILRCEGEARASKDEVAYYAMVPKSESDGERSEPGEGLNAHLPSSRPHDNYPSRGLPVAVAVILLSMKRSAPKLRIDVSCRSTLTSATAAPAERARSSAILRASSLA
jgi:hypothetical protein